VGGSGPATSEVKYDTNPKRVIAFNPGLSAGSYKAQYFILSKLSFDAAAGNYQLLRPNGGLKVFGADGRITAAYDTGGHASDYHYDDTTGRPASISKDLAGVPAGYTIVWAGEKVSQIVYWIGVGEVPVMKTEFAYDGDNLRTVKVRQAAGAGWSAPIAATRYTYHAGSGLLRHIIAPAQYRQMVNNGLDPDGDDMSLLGDYATTEYQYGGDKRVSVLYTHGRRYAYGFAYATNNPGGSSLNVWTAKTTVTAPDGSRRTYYFNRGGQMILQKVSANELPSAKTWYPLYQRFEQVSGRVVLSAAGSAVNVVNEAIPSLGTLKAYGGKGTWYTYNAQG